MNTFDVLKKMGYKITWKLIYMGLYGFDDIEPSITYDELYDYFDDMLTDVNEESETFISLWCEKDNCEKVHDMLKKLFDHDTSDIGLQKKKWISFLLSSELDTISDDVVTGLMQLVEFWLPLREYEDCPHVFYDDETVNSIPNYFTQSMYDFLLKKNRDWLDQTITEILTVESISFK